MGKQVTVLIRRPPLNSEKTAEALRVAVGYTLAAGQRVTACFVGDGVYAAGALRPDLVGAPELEKHLTSLKALGHRLVADASPVRECPPLTLRAEVEVLEPEGILELLTDSDLVVPFWGNAMRILHIIRHPDEQMGWRVAEAQAGRHEVAVLLLQDGVLSRRQTALPRYASALDLEARGLRADRVKPLTDAEIVEVLAAHDRLVTW